MQNDLDTIQTKRKREREKDKNTERGIYDHRQDKKKKAGRAQRRKDLVLFL